MYGERFCQACTTNLPANREYSEEKHDCNEEDLVWQWSVHEEESVASAHICAREGREDHCDIRAIEDECSDTDRNQPPCLVIGSGDEQEDGCKTEDREC